MESFESSDLLKHVFSFWMFVWKHYNPCNLCNPCMGKMYTCYLVVSFFGLSNTTGKQAAIFMKTVQTYHNFRYRGELGILG